MQRMAINPQTPPPPKGISKGLDPVSSDPPVGPSNHIDSAFPFIKNNVMIQMIKLPGTSISSFSGMNKIPYVPLP